MGEWAATSGTQRTDAARIGSLVAATKGASPPARGVSSRNRSSAWLTCTGWSGPAARSQATCDKISSEQSLTRITAPRSAGITSKIIPRSAHCSDSTSRIEPMAVLIRSSALKFRDRRSDWGKAANDSGLRYKSPSRWICWSGGFSANSSSSCNGLEIARETSVWNKNTESPIAI